MSCTGQRICLLATSGPDGVAALEEYVAPGTKAAKLVSDMIYVDIHFTPDVYACQIASASQHSLRHTCNDAFEATTSFTQAGWVVFTDVVVYTSAQEFAKDSCRHGVHSDTPYSWVPGVKQGPIARAQ